MTIFIHIHTHITNNIVFYQLYCIDTHTYNIYAYINVNLNYHNINKEQLFYQRQIWELIYFFS